MNINQQHIDKFFTQDDTGELMYETLVKICSDYPKHTNKREIFAKVVIIGRSFQADILRRKNKNDKKNDVIYKEAVEALLNSDIDSRLMDIANLTRLQDEKDIRYIFEIHNNLVEKLHKIVGQNNRSFVSKYLHFHLPNVFFIYDSFAREGLAHIVGKRYTPKRNYIEGDYDGSYRNFVLCCLDLQDYIKTTFNEDMNPRAIDILLTFGAFHPSNST